MNTLSITNAALICMLFAAAFILFGASAGMLVPGAALLLALGGVRTARVYYKRAKIYEKHSDIGPDA